jgi:hypothetical protein
MTFTTKELDLLIAYCDLACKTGGINAAIDALPLAQKLVAMKDTLPTTE